MSIDAINAYATTTAATSTSSTTSKSSALDMDDFLKLMVAQLQNQDMNNSVDNTEFAAQMAQYSMVQALSDMREQSQTAYSVSLIGKDVSLSESNDDGSVSVITGTVEGVNLQNGDAEIIVNGSAYSMDSILTVAQATE